MPQFAYTQKKTFKNTTNSVEDLRLLKSIADLLSKPPAQPLSLFFKKPNDYDKLSSGEKINYDELSSGERINYDLQQGEELLNSSNSLGLPKKDTLYIGEQILANRPIDLKAITYSGDKISAIKHVAIMLGVSSYPVISKIIEKMLDNHYKVPTQIQLSEPLYKQALSEKILSVGRGKGMLDSGTVYICQQILSAQVDIKTLKAANNNYAPRNRSDIKAPPCWPSHTKQ